MQFVPFQVTHNMVQFIGIFHIYRLYLWYICILYVVLIVYLTRTELIFNVNRVAYCCSECYE